MGFGLVGPFIWLCGLWLLLAFGLDTFICPYLIDPSLPPPYPSPFDLVYSFLVLVGFIWPWFWLPPHGSTLHPHIPSPLPLCPGPLPCITCNPHPTLFCVLDMYDIVVMTLKPQLPVNFLYPLILPSYCVNFSCIWLCWHCTLFGCLTFLLPLLQLFEPLVVVVIIVCLGPCIATRCCWQFEKRTFSYCSWFPLPFAVPSRTPPLTPTPLLFAPVPSDIVQFPTPFPLLPCLPQFTWHYLTFFPFYPHPTHTVPPCPDPFLQPLVGCLVR